MGRGVGSLAAVRSSGNPLVYLIGQEDGLRLTVRAEGDWCRCRALAAEPCENSGKPLPDFRQRMHMDHSRTSHNH